MISRQEGSGKTIMVRSIHAVVEKPGHDDVHHICSNTLSCSYNMGRKIILENGCSGINLDRAHKLQLNLSMVGNSAKAKNTQAGKPDNHDRPEQ